MLLNTHLAACAGVVGGMFYMIVSRSPLLMTNTVYSSIGGLVAITAGCATMYPVYALITGFIGGMIAISGIKIMELFHLDNVIGAVPVHGFCGVWGTLAAGLFKSGDLFNTQIILTQITGIVAALLWTFTTVFILYWLVNTIFGLRASTSHELKGLDFTDHYEIGYHEFMDTTLQEGKE